MTRMKPAPNKSQCAMLESSRALGESIRSIGIPTGVVNRRMDTAKSARKRKVEREQLSLPDCGILIIPSHGRGSKLRSMFPLPVGLMHRLAILFFALAPSIVLLQYGVAKARARWDDSLIWEAFFSGGVATIFVLVPALLLKSVFAIDAMSSVHAAATNALVVAAIPEEAMKLGALFYMIKRHGDDAGRHDLITLAFAVGLGFAAIENIGYLLAPGDWQLVAANRAMLSVPGHGLNGLAMGACLTAAELHPRHRRLLLIASLAIPILMHASYDFPLMLFAKN